MRVELKGFGWIIGLHFVAVGHGVGVKIGFSGPNGRVWTPWTPFGPRILKVRVYDFLFLFIYLYRLDTLDIKIRLIKLWIEFL